MSNPGQSLPPQQICLIGGGGHALVVGEAAELNHAYCVAGYFDDSGQPLLSRLTSYPHLGTINNISNPRFNQAGLPFIMCIGDVAARRKVLSQVGAQNYITVLHPNASISPTAAVGKGVFVGPRAVVHSRAHVGDHCIVNSGAIVEHECDIGTNSHIAPGAVLAGNVSIGTCTLVGIGARVLPGVTIGSNVTIGAGAVVLADVPDDTTVVGVHKR